MANKPVSVTITGDAKGLITALNQGTSSLKTFAQDVNGISSGVMGVVKNIQAPIMALTAIIGGGAMLRGAVRETVDWAVQAQKLARVLGTTTENASAWGVAIKAIHGDADTFLAITAKMTRTLNTQESAFHKVGVATRDSAGHLRDAQSVLLDTFSALSQFKAGTDRNIASTQIFGRSWMEVGKYLQINRSVLEEAREKAERLNLVVGGDSVAASNAYRKSSEELDLTLKGLKLRLGQELLPVMTQFNSTAANDGPDAIAALGYALKALMEILDAVWSGVKMAGLGAWSLIHGIYDTLIQLISTAVGFLQGGIPEAKRQWQITKAEADKNWNETQAHLDAISSAYSDRSWDRWNKVAKAAAKAVVPTPEGKDADTEEHTHRKKIENANQDEINRMRSESAGLLEKETLAEKESAEIEAARVRLNQDLSRLEKERKEGRLTEGQLQARGLEAVENYETAVTNAHKHATDAREKIDKDTRSRTETLEEDGIEAQIKRKRDEFARINEERRKANLEAIPQQALEEQIASMKARSMLANRNSSQWGARAGVNAGLEDYTRQATNGFETMRGVVGETLQGIQGGFAKTFQGILSGQMSLRQGMKSIWKDIAAVVVGALAQIAAQYIVAAIAQKVFAVSNQTTAATQTAAATQQAAAETWASYAPIPFAGQGLAMAQIAVMMASIAAAGAMPVVAHAAGGLIDRPTLALMGEIPGSREIVAPENTFKDWASNLTRNLLDSERRTQGYQALGGQYAMAAAQASPDAWSGLHVHLEGSMIMGESVESSRIIGKRLKGALDDWARRHG